MMFGRKKKATPQKDVWTVAIVNRSTVTVDFDHKSGRDFEGSVLLNGAPFTFVWGKTFDEVLEKARMEKKRHEQMQAAKSGKMTVEL